MENQTLGSLLTSSAVRRSRAAEVALVRERLWGAARDLYRLSISSKDHSSVGETLIRAALDNLEQIILTLEKLVDVQAGDSTFQAACLLLGTAHWMTGEYLRAVKPEDPEATAHYDRACVWFDSVPLSLLTNDEDGAQQYAWALEHTGRRSDAVAFLQSIAASDVLPARAFLDYALFLEQCGDVENGSLMLATAVECAAEDEDSQLELGQALESAGHSREALEVYLAGAALYSESEEWENTLEACDRALRLAPEHGEARALRGRALVALGQAEEALSTLYEVATVYPDAPHRIILAKALVSTARTQEALDLLAQVLAADQTNADALCVMAEAYNQAGSWANALEMSNAALNHRPGMKAALLQKAMSYGKLGELDQALAAVEEVLTRETGDMQAALVKLDLLLNHRQWEKAAAEASQLLDRSVTSIRMAEIYLRRGIARLELKSLEEAASDFQRAWETDPNLNEAISLLLRALRGTNRWQDVIQVLDRLLKKSPDATEWLLAKVDALRRLGRQDDALRELARLDVSAADIEFIRLKAALLCDIGDFEGALEHLVPATSPVDSAQHLLLSLRGWAHQNCNGEAHAQQAELTYRRALVLMPEDRWSRKGLANSLRRLGRDPEANQEYEEVIRFVEAQRAAGTLNPYDACLAGWCYYCVGRFKEGADSCAAGLATVGVGVAAQFDYGLILLADSCFQAARAQFERSIRDMESKNDLRRCGLLYVALFDLRDAIRTYGNIAEAAETNEIEALLKEALLKTLRNLSAEWEYLVIRMSSYIRDDHRGVTGEIVLDSPAPAAPVELDWRKLHIAGFSISGWSAPCAICMPVFGHSEQPGILFEISASGELIRTENASESLSRDADEVSVVRFTSSYPASAPSRVLWVSKMMLEAIGADARTESGEHLKWEEISAPVQSWAGATIQQSAERLLDHWAQRLIRKSVELLTEYLKTTSDEKLAEAVEVGGYAIASARDQGILYQGVLARGAAGGDVSEGVLLKLRSGLTSRFFDDVEDLQRSIEDFKDLVRLQVCTQTPPAFCGEVETPESLKSQNQLIQHILKRAHKISQIEDPVQQYRSAEKASAEMQLLIPITDALRPYHAKLADTLNSQDRFYLDRDESILLISREPAFYTASVLLPLSRPVVRSFAFLTAARNMQKLEIAAPVESLFRAQ